MQVLVMGGTEFISAAMAKHLIAKGYTVDIFTRGLRPIAYAGFREHLKGDRKSSGDLQKLLRNREYDFVFDISAYTKDDVEKLCAVLKHKAIKRYVFCSSGTVYLESDEFVSEDMARGHNTNWGDYGLNKKEAEDYLLELHEKEGLPVTIFRPTYAYGDGNNLYREGYFFDRINAGMDIPIPDNDKYNQFVYVGDLVKTFESVIHCEKANGQAYNVTHPRQVTWENLVDTAMEVAGKKVDVVRVSSENMGKLNMKAREFFPFRDLTYLLGIDKLKNDSLFVPEVDLKEGLEKSYAWYSVAKPELQDLSMTKVDLALGLK